MRMQRFREKLKLPWNAEKLQEYNKNSRKHSENYRKRQLEDPEKARIFREKRARQAAERRKRKMINNSQGLKTKSGKKKTM